MKIDKMNNGIQGSNGPTRQTTNLWREKNAISIINVNKQNEKEKETCIVTLFL